MGKSLEQLEKHTLGEPEFDSYLVRTCLQLWKTPIDDLGVEDLRIMIGQNIGVVSQVVVQELWQTRLPTPDSRRLPRQAGYPQLLNHHLGHDPPPLFQFVEDSGQ